MDDLLSRGLPAWAAGRGSDPVEGEARAVL